VLQSYNRLPLSFEANKGQFTPGVTYVARGAGYAMGVSATEVAFSLRSDATRTKVNWAGGKNALIRALILPASLPVQERSKRDSKAHPMRS